MSTPLLKGRYGLYTPRSPVERARARERAAAQRAKAASTATWLERHRWCANGCGKPTAMYEGPFPSLRFDGCCSEACALARKQASDKGVGRLD